jgi:hypothetical protein
MATAKEKKAEKEHKALDDQRVIDAEKNKQAVLEAEAKKAAEYAANRHSFTSTIYMKDPWTNKVFDKSIVTDDVLITSWVQSQIDAGLLKEV